MSAVQRPRRILVIRQSAIGDIIMASGLIPALKSRWPEARLGWLVEDVPADLLRHHPRLDRLHVLPRRRWRALREAGDYRAWLREVRGFVNELRSESYDWALDLQGLLKSSVWAYASGASRRVGLGSREGSQWLMTEVIPREMEDPRIGKEYRDLAVRLGAAPESFVLDVAVPGSARERMARLLKEQGVRGAYAVLAPFTTRPQKHWFDSEWAALAERLSLGLKPILLGGPGDRERAGQIMGYPHGALLDLVGRTSLIESAALIRGAALLIGVDTGLTHLGSAFAIPTVALFGSTAPYRETAHSTGRVLYVPRDCSPCHRRPICEGRFDCMRAHTVDSVLAAVGSLRVPEICQELGYG